MPALAERQDLLQVTPSRTVREGREALAWLTALLAETPPALLVPLTGRPFGPKGVRDTPEGRQAWTAGVLEMWRHVLAGWLDGEKHVTREWDKRAGAHGAWRDREHPMWGNFCAFDGLANVLPAVQAYRARCASDWRSADAKAEADLKTENEGIHDDYID